MTPRLLLTMTLLASVLAVRAPAEEDVEILPVGGARGSRKIPRDQIIPQARRQFGNLKASIREKYKEDADQFLPVVDRTQANFEREAEKALTQEEYRSWELWAMRRAVGEVIVPGLADRFRTMREVQRSGGDMQAALAGLHERNKARISAYKADVDRESRHAQALERGKPTETALERTDSPENRRDAPGESRPGWPSGEDSEIVKLGERSAELAMQLPPAPGPTPSPNPNPNPGGGWTPPAGGGPSSPGGGSSSGLDGIMDDIFKGKMPAVILDQGVAQYQNGDFNGAYQSAQKVLEMAPGDKNALGLLYTAKERGGGPAVPEAGAGGGQGGGQSGGATGFGGAASLASLASGPSADAARGAAQDARRAASNALKLGDRSAAIAIFDKALGQDPGNPQLLNDRAQLHARGGDWDLALRDAVAGLGLAPGNAALLGTKAYAELRKGLWREARATAEAAIAADPSNPYAYAYRAHALGKLGDREGMLADLARAAALDPRFKKTLEDAQQLQLPTDDDVLFLFPGEQGGAVSAPAGAAKAKRFGGMAGAALIGGILLALGLLRTVLAPVKDAAVSVFTRLSRRGPSVSGATPVATPGPSSAAGHLPGLIRGQYEVTRQIGAGGMGMVFEGTDRSLNRKVAIKRMREELKASPRDRERFVLEAKTVAALKHPGIVDIYAIAEDGPEVYLVFEFVDGTTVSDRLQKEGRLQPGEAARIVRAAADALTYAHGRGVVHRDMKPSNVMLDARGAVKVMDFGIARMAKDALTRYSMTNTVVGTPPYMAPEQEQGQVRKESDSYALAVCAYEMLTGKLPFIGVGAGMLMNKINMNFVPPSRAIAGLPESLDAVFAQAFQADPDKRYRAPADFAAALEGALGGTKAAA